MKTILKLITVLGVILLTHPVFANGAVDVQLNFASYDCTSGLITVDIEVRAKESSSTFFIEGQNYRFSYDNSVVTNPVIVQELTLSGMINNPNYHAAFEPHTLQGTTNSVVSYNVVLAGGTGSPISSDAWTKVGRVGFTVVDANQVVDLKLHDTDPQNFPNTFIAEVKPNGQLAEVAGNTYTGLKTGTYTDGCNMTNSDELSTITGLELYPNPVSDSDVAIQLEFTSEMAGANSELVLTTIDGKHIAIQNVDVTTGKNVLQYNTQELATGVYMIQITNPKWESKAVKFIKIQ